jgi:hypothetical protein
MYFLPQNPGCNSSPLINTVPCSSGDPCTTQLTASSYVSYSGPNLPCTGIQTCDTLTVALQKIDVDICDLINTTISLQNQINALTTTTTSTSTSTSTSTTTTTTTIPPTTTTTTTLPVGIYAFQMKYNALGGTQACSETVSNVYYSNSATLNLFSGLTTDPAFTIPAPAGYYCLTVGCPNPTGSSWVRVTGAFGQITSAANC